MRSIHRTLGAAALGLSLTATASAQVMNELYISMGGADTFEFVEVVGTPNASTDGMMFLVIEGDCPACGTLDRVYDLSGNMIPADGYFVIGTPTAGNNDFDFGSGDQLENGTNTYYLISTTDTNAVMALLGTNVDMDGDLVTDIATMGTVTILDIIATTDDSTGFDMTYDGAQVIGPDQVCCANDEEPAGIFRPADSPNPWCDTVFLDFDPAANMNAMRTPGEMNTTDPACGPNVLGMNYCVAAPNSAGAGAIMSATGSANVADMDVTLATNGVPPGRPGIYFFGPNQVQLPFGDGFRCVGGTTTRVQPIAVADGNGDAMSVLNFAAPYAAAIQPGLRNFQFWYRDPMGGPAGFNLSDGLGVMFQ